MPLPVDGIGSVATRTRGTVSFNIRPINGEKNTVAINAHILKEITSDLPSNAVDITQWGHIKDLELADPNLGRPAPIDILFGADIWGVVLREGFIFRVPEEPYAIATCFGWVVFGPTNSNRSTNTIRASLLATSHADKDLTDLLQRFWAVEEPPAVTVDPDDQCERIYATTVTRADDGRYSIQIPFRPDAPVIGESYRVAERQFQQLERRLEFDSLLKQNTWHLFASISPWATCIKSRCRLRTSIPRITSLITRSRRNSEWFLMHL